MQRLFKGLAAVAATLALAVGTLATPASADGHTLFISSAVEHPDDTVTLPLHRGTSHGQTVLYVITDTSNGSLAQSLGVNTAQKLANAARSTTAVQKVGLNPDGSLNFPATVNFSQTRQVVPGPAGFPPTTAVPGPMGETGYSPLIQLPDGSIVNAPHVANSTGRAPKVVSIAADGTSVVYRETHGFQGGNPVRYASFDASDPLAATLENVTYAPALNAAPKAGDDSTASARASLAAFTNGQTGAANPQRQGLNSALLDGLDPLNVLRWNPSQGRYSPLWDVHLAQWSAAAVASGQSLRQTDWGTVQGLADHGQVTGFGGGAFVANGFIVNCPIVSSN
jgi:hypothetical protein